MEQIVSSSHMIGAGHTNMPQSPPQLFRGVDAMDWHRDILSWLLAHRASSGSSASDSGCDVCAVLCWSGIRYLLVVESVGAIEREEV